MKYRAKITNVISQIRNIRAYAQSEILRDERDRWIDVDTIDEALLIEELNDTIGKARHLLCKLEAISIG